METFEFPERPKPYPWTTPPDGTVEVVPFQYFVPYADKLEDALSARDQRIAELEKDAEAKNAILTVGNGLNVYGSLEAILRAQDYILLDSKHPQEAIDVRRSLARALQETEAALTTTQAECDKAVESIRQCRVFLRGCMNHAFDETPIVEVAKDVSAEFHRNRYQLQCMAKERDDIAKERDAANLLLKRLMCVVVPDNAVPNDMKEFVRDSSATVLKDLWDYLKTDADLRKTEHDAK